MKSSLITAITFLCISLMELTFAVIDFVNKDLFCGISMVSSGLVILFVSLCVFLVYSDERKKKKLPEPILSVGEYARWGHKKVIVLGNSYKDKEIWYNVLFEDVVYAIPEYKLKNWNYERVKIDKE